MPDEKTDEKTEMLLDTRDSEEYRQEIIERVRELSDKEGIGSDEAIERIIDMEVDLRKASKASQVDYWKDWGA